MRDVVGANVPSAQEVDEAVKQVKKLEATLAKYTTRLSKSERKSATKMRPGGEAIAGLIGKLAEDQGLTLPGISVQGMRADLEVVQRLRPLAQEVESLGRLLSDTLLEANSEAWWAAMAFYSSLGRMTPADAKLEAALRPAVDFFATGRRKKIEEEEE